jgi:T4 RnlA family RNA ligase
MYIFENLMALCEPEDSPFYFTDVTWAFIGDAKIFHRIFLYRMASYTDFCKPDALECRGIMFEVEEVGELQAVKLVSLPPEKFFNLGENPFTDYSIEYVVENAELVMNKEDGSLISSYMAPDNTLKLKSKGSLSSVQALDAMVHLDGDFRFNMTVLGYTVSGYTVNMEWTAPHNRIVLGYTNPSLTVLSVRHNETGEYVSHTALIKDFGLNYVDLVDKSQIETYRSQTGVEGYVVRLSSGQHLKLKTDWYVTLHHNKDSVNSPRRLFEACLDEATDDLKQMFEDDEQALKLIHDMEVLASRECAKLSETVQHFYRTNSGLIRKDYAILGLEKLTKGEFGLAMMLYVGKVPDFVGYMKKNYKLYVGEEI